MASRQAAFKKRGGRETLYAGISVAQRGPGAYLWRALVARSWRAVIKTFDGRQPLHAGGPFSQRGPEVYLWSVLVMVTWRAVMKKSTIGSILARGNRDTLCLRRTRQAGITRADAVH